MRIAIIGTAGRSRKDSLTKELFRKMVAAVENEITPDAILVSGGAAWADHVAVELFLQGKCAGLELYLPCEHDGFQFVDNGDGHWARNPGRLANKYHKYFSFVLGVDTLGAIDQALNQGAVKRVYNGFHARNTLVATTCDKLVALTWATSDTEIEGGTKDTWTKCKLPPPQKKHVCLRTI